MTVRREVTTMSNPCTGCKQEYPMCRRICSMGIRYQQKMAADRERARIARNEEAALAAYKFDRIEDTKKKCGME